MWEVQSALQKSCKIFSAKSTFIILLKYSLVCDKEGVYTCTLLRDNVEIKGEWVHRLATVYYGIHFDPKCAPVKQNNVNLNKTIEYTGQIKFF